MFHFIIFFFQVYLDVSLYLNYFYKDQFSLASEALISRNIGILSGLPPLNCISHTARTKVENSLESYAGDKALAFNA